MKDLIRSIVIVVSMGLLPGCTDTAPTVPEVGDSSEGAASECNPLKEYWAADYWTPLVAQRYGLRTFEWTLGESGTFTSRIVGTRTVPYLTGAITGTIVWFGDEVLLLHVDGRSLYQLNDNGRLLET